MTHSTVIAFCFCGAQSLLVGDISFVCLVSASVSKRCLSTSFSPVFLSNLYLLSNLLSSDTFIESSDKILLELRPFDFFQPRIWWP